MKLLRFFLAVFVITNLAISWTPPKASGQDYYSQDEQNKKVLKQAVLGAGVGAVSAGASGGSAGKGALIGAGTNVIGSAILDTLTSSPSPQPQQQAVYVQEAPQQVRYDVQETSERGYAPVQVDVQTKRGGCSRN